MLNKISAIILTGLLLMIMSCSEEKTQETTAVKSDIDFSLNQTNFETRDFSATDLYTTKRVSDFTLSPDGQWLVYRLSTPSIADNKLYSDLFAVKIDGSEKIQLTNNTAPEFNARFISDNKLAFITTVDGSPQIYIMDFPKGTPKKFTNVENGVSNFVHAGVPGTFVFASEIKAYESLKDQYPKFDKANMHFYDDLHIRHWDEWNDEMVSHIFVAPVEGGEPKDIMEGEKYESPLKPFGGAEEYDISPDEKEIAYTSKKVSDYPWSTNSDIYLYDIENGTTKNITEGMLGYDKNPKYSPDGNLIAFVSQERPGFESDRIRLMVYNRLDGIITEISKTLDQWVEEFVWTPDSKSFYLVAGNQGTVQIFHLDLEGNWKIVTEGIHKIGSGLNITNDGKTLVFGKQSFTEPLDIYSMDIESGNMNQITDENKKLYEKINKVKVEERWFTANDGKKIHSWIIYPPNFDPNKKYPVVTYCQGGPQSMISPNFHYRWNQFLFASQGYIMLAANRRGVPGFGQAWNDSISLDWGGMPMNDLLAATDQFSQEPFVKLDGRAAMGASAGGYAAFWLAGHHNKRFSAFVSHCGVFNLISKYGATEELFFPNWEFGGPYWDTKHRAQFEKFSPHNYVKNWDSPIFISTGMKDFRVPYTQSLEAFTAARAQGIPAEICIFPDENHFIGKPQEFIIWSDKLFKFLDKNLK
ncbi:MAG: S9 family peptidase [Candidatus Kapabacteria bacterium]|nr:S9 family peptidase [Ignavibacteriota bacterium]MCW5883680.1 S9 family peptidase [Candidatus Kapabacteria bacterium]